MTVKWVIVNWKTPWNQQSDYKGRGHGRKICDDIRAEAARFAQLTSGGVGAMLDETANFP